MKRLLKIFASQLLIYTMALGLLFPTQVTAKVDKQLKTDTTYLMTLAQLKAANSLGLVMGNFNFNLHFEVQRYIVSAVIQGYDYEIHVRGGNFTEEVKKLFDKMKVGQKVYFEQIIVKGSDGSLRKISPIVIKIR